MSNLIIHNWNSSAIAQLSEATKIAEYDVPAGYINATQMCKANGKQWKHCAENESSKEFWDALSRSVGIPTNLLVISIKTGSNSTRGTWTHPDIGIDLATWVSADFKVWAMQTIRQIITGQLPQAQVTPPQPLLPTPTLEEISNLLDLTLGKAGLDKNLVAGAKLNAIAKRFPHLLQEAEEAKSLLVMPIEDRLLTPTQVGEILQERTGEKWSARRVNKVLIEKGLQTPNEGGDPDYLPTENGKQYGTVTYGTAKRHGKTVQHLRWYPTIVEALEL